MTILCTGKGFSGMTSCTGGVVIEHSMMGYGIGGPEMEQREAWFTTSTS